MDFFYYYFAAVVFLFGLVFGSFLNVCIYRLPRELSVVSPGSACPECKHSIQWRDNIPVLSWILLRGRCRNCSARITPRYAVVELTTALLFLFCYFHFGPTLETLKSCVFCFLVLGLIFTDLETFLLPDKLTLTGLGIGVVVAMIVPVGSFLEQRYLARALFTGRFDVNTARLLSLADALIGAAVGAGFIFLVGEVYLRLRGIEGMGLGDVKLMAMVGAFLGAEKTVFVLFVASIIGSIFGLSAVVSRYRRRLAHFRSKGLANATRRARKSAAAALRFQEMPFGVFLGGASLVALFYGEHVVAWYARLLYW
jgi:leader peptidase (prepilin peptidase)/N-methyltransferase